MKLHPCKFQDQRGFSMMELLIVIAVIAIVSTIAIININPAKPQFSRQNVARELKSAFERARFDSVKRRASGAARANVIVTGTSFTLNTDVNQNGTIEGGEARLNTSWSSGITIRNSDGTTPNVTVVFDNRGEVSTSGGAALFTVCNGDCSVSNSNIILVTPSGTVNLLPGNASIPTFPTPTITSVSSGSEINYDVVIPTPTP